MLQSLCEKSLWLLVPLSFVNEIDLGHDTYEREQVAILESRLNVESQFEM